MYDKPYKLDTKKLICTKSCNNKFAEHFYGTHRKHSLFDNELHM